MEWDKKVQGGLSIETQSLKVQAPPNSHLVIMVNDPNAKTATRRGAAPTRGGRRSRGAAPTNIKRKGSSSAGPLNRISGPRL